MKSTIKIKLRTLILLILAFAFLGVGTHFFIRHMVPSNTLSLESESKRLDTLINENHYAFFNFVNVADGMAMGYSRIQWHDGLDILNAYHRLKNTPNLEASYVLNVALSQYFSGHLLSAKEVIDTADTAGWYPLDLDRLELIRAAIALNSPEKNIELATNALSKIESPEYERVVNTLKAYMALTLGADVAYTDGNYVDLRINGEESYARYFETLTPILKNLTRENNDGSLNSLTVKVTYHGKPYKGALVYQRQNAGSSTSLLDEPAGITNHEGLAKIPVQEENDFGVGIFMPWQLIHTSLWQSDSGNRRLNLKEVDYQFDFEQGIKFSELKISNKTLVYEIADKGSLPKRNYRLHVGYGQDVTGDLKYNTYGYIPLSKMQGAIPLEDLRKEMALPFSTNHFNEGAFTLENFLEPLYLKERYRFCIQVDDEQGSYWNGCYSNALDTFLEVNGADALSQGDLYLESGDLEKAKAFYWKDESLHSLNVLESLYMSENDWNQVIKVLEKMASRYGHSNRSKNSLCFAYGQNKDFQKQESLIREMLLEEPESKVLNSELGHCLIRQGRYLEGIDYLKSTNTLTNYPYWNASLYLAGNQIEALPEDLKPLAKRLHENLDANVFNLITSGSYDLAYEKVLAMPSSDEKLYLKLLLEDAFEHLSPDQDDFIAYYTKSLEKIKNQDYVALLKGIKKAHNWF